MADPPPVEDRRLVDDVRALAHQPLRLSRALLVRVIPIVVAGYHLAPTRLEQLDVAPLVGVATALEQQHLRILALTVWKVLRGEGVSAAGHATMPEFRGSGRES